MKILKAALLLSGMSLGCSASSGGHASPDAATQDGAGGGDARTADARTGDAAPPADAGADSGGGSRDAGHHVVRPCMPDGGGLGPDGTWSAITPTQVSLDADAATGAGQNYGTNDFILDPQDTATVYLGTSGQGIYKSTDCGSTWAHVNTGTNGKVLDDGRQWAMAIDPDNPQVIYANSGYGTNGMFRSSNGGVDWDQILSPSVAQNFVFGGFVGGIAMDPTNSQHILLYPHFTCCDDAGTCTSSCLLESHDAGGSWTRLDVQGSSPNGQEGYGVMIVPDPSNPTSSKHWFWAETFGGLYESVDGGGSWKLVTSASGYAYPSLFTAPDGTSFVPAAFDVLSNEGGTWNALQSSPGAHVVAGSATTLYASSGYCTAVSAPFQPISSAPLSDPTHWTTMASPSMTSGPGYLQYDADHHLLYASACRGGFWRGVVP